MGDNDNSNVTRYRILFDKEIPEQVVDKSNRWRFLKRALTRVLRGEKDNAVIEVDTHHEARLAQASAYQWGRSIRIEEKYKKKVSTNIAPQDANGEVVRSDEASKFLVFVELDKLSEEEIQETEKKGESDQEDNRELEPVLS